MKSVDSTQKKLHNKLDRIVAVVCDTGGGHRKFSTHMQTMVARHDGKSTKTTIKHNGNEEQ